jgi:serine/threonine protein kinase
VSLDAKDLIRRLLAKQPKQRITADELLSHPWLKRSVASKTLNIEDVCSSPVPELDSPNTVSTNDSSEK